MKTRRIQFMLLSFIAAAVLSLSGSSAFSEKFVVQSQIIDADKCQDLAQCFDDINFDLAEVRLGNAEVPALRISTLPNDMGAFKKLNRKKDTFIRAILPMILIANAEIRHDKETLLLLKEKEKLSTSDERILENLRKHYKMDTLDLKELEIRVDEIPTSLALAQAIVETGWGSSFAARHKNALFGITLKSGVKSYDNAYASVLDYMRNLNTHYAYKSMRLLRQSMRQKGENLDSKQLIKKMPLYCEYRNRYIRQVTSLMNQNDLHHFDGAELDSGVSFPSKQDNLDNSELHSSTSSKAGRLSILLTPS